MSTSGSSAYDAARDRILNRVQDMVCLLDNHRETLTCSCTPEETAKFELIVDDLRNDLLAIRDNIDDSVFRRDALLAFTANLDMFELMIQPYINKSTD